MENAIIYTIYFLGLVNLMNLASLLAGTALSVLLYGVFIE